MKNKKPVVRVAIDRDEPKVFEGNVLAETDSHYYVQHGVNPELGEWFSKASNRVHCHVVGLPTQ